MKNFLEPKVHILIEKDKKFLFLRRFNTGCYDGYWCMPTGRVEKEENPKAAAERETLEEVGLNIDLVFVSSVYAKVPNILSSSFECYEDLCFFFEGKTTAEPINCEPEKHDKIAWFSLENLPNPIMPVAEFGIECYIKGKSYGEFGYE